MRTKDPSTPEKLSNSSTVELPLRRSALLRIPQVVGLVGVKKSTIWKWSSEGKFPSPLKLSSRVTVWRAVDVLAWIEERSNLPR